MQHHNESESTPNASQFTEHICLTSNDIVKEREPQIALRRLKWLYSETYQNFLWTRLTFSWIYI